MKFLLVTEERGTLTEIRAVLVLCPVSGSVFRKLDDWTQPCSNSKVHLPLPTWTCSDTYESTPSLHALRSCIWESPAPSLQLPFQLEGADVSAQAWLCGSYEQ